jgi:hypothetical protein
MLANSTHNHINLLVREHAPGTLCKRRHLSPGNAIGSYTSQDRIIGDGEVNWICEGNRSSTLPVGPVATGTVL